jgi:predicted component of type VI protein secretion system
MRKVYIALTVILLMLITTGCSAKEEYFSRDEAIRKGYVVLDGTNSENHDRFSIFMQNYDAKREDSIMIVIYDLKRSQYVINIHFDGELIHASRYFMDTDSKKSQVADNLVYSHITKTESNNYFLFDANKIHEHLWIYQGN